MRILARTFRVSLTVTLGCLLLGYPTAYVLSRVSGRVRRVLLLLVIVPYLTSFLVRTYAWMVLLGPKGIINSLLLATGLADAPVKLLYSAIGVHVGMIHVLLPLMVLPLYSVMVGIDRNYLKAAQTLGGSDLSIFARVVLPLLTPALLAGVSLCFARSLGEFGAIIFIAGNQPFETEITALLAFIRLEEYDYPASAAIASVMLIAAFVMLAVTNLMQARALRYTVRN